MALAEQRQSQHLPEDEHDQLTRTDERSPMMAASRAAWGLSGGGATMPHQEAGVAGGAGALSGQSKRPRGAASESAGSQKTEPRQPSGTGSKQRGSGLQIEIETYEQQMDSAGCVTAPGADGEERDLDGHVAGPALAEAQVVKNIVLFSKSPEH